MLRRTHIVILPSLKLRTLVFVLLLDEVWSDVYPMLKSLRIHKQPFRPSSASFSSYALISFEVREGETRAYRCSGQDVPARTHAGVEAQISQTKHVLTGGGHSLYLTSFIS